MNNAIETGKFTNLTTAVFTGFVDMVAALNIFVFVAGAVTLMYRFFNGLIAIDAVLLYVGVYFLFFVVFGAFTLGISAYNKLSFIVDIKKKEIDEIVRDINKNQTTQRVEPTI